MFIYKKNRYQLKSFLESSWFIIIFFFSSGLFYIAHFLNLSIEHTSLYVVIEFINIFMLFSISLIVWYTYEHCNSFLKILGTSFLTIGLIKFFHTLSLPGMPQFIINSSEQKSMLFWGISRLLESVALLVSGIISNTDYKMNLSRGCSFSGAIVTSLIILLSVFYFSFPQILLVNPYFLTGIIESFLIIAMFLFWKRSGKLMQGSYKLMVGGIVISMFAEAALTFHSSTIMIFNLLGHVYKLVAYVFIFHVLFGQTVRQPFEDIEIMLKQTISSISRALDGRDKYTYNHSVRVADYACAIGQMLQVDKKLKENLRLSGLLHDIGKIAVPDNVLNKAGSLTTTEWDMIKLHPAKSAEILEPIERLQLLRGISEHHERIDGRGYPTGKSGEEISLEAKILAVADTFDALTSDRIYRPKKSKADAIDIIIDAAGSQLDSQVVEAFIKADSQGLIDTIMSN